MNKRPKASPKVRPINVKNRAARRGLTASVLSNGKHWFAFCYRSDSDAKILAQFERRREAWAYLATVVDSHNVIS